MSVICPDCNKEFDSRQIGPHRRWNHPKKGKAGKPPKEPKPVRARPSGATGSAIADAIDEIKRKRDDLVALVIAEHPEISKLDVAIKTLEDLETK